MINSTRPCTGASHRATAISIPAFPYPYFTKVTRDDAMEIRAYLATLPAIRKANREPDLSWPLSERFLMAAWNLFYFDEGGFMPDASKSAEWNRGAYLVEGLGHCGSCHTPKNVAGADDNDRHLEGGSIQGWFAPNITGDGRAGIGSWSTQDIVDYLKNGRNDHSGATGLMAEVVTNSTSKLDAPDLRAIAVYLKGLSGHPAPASPLPVSAMLQAGRSIYSDSCSACHGAEGHGVPQLFSPLAGSALLQSTDPTTAIRLVLEGARTAPTAKRPTPAAMPAYAWKLSDAQIAAVLSYVRNSWGNAAEEVTSSQVNAVRERLDTRRTQSANR